jgi:ribose/xylose/arabinose/galactoside ABC-type transport system permease subunit
MQTLYNLIVLWKIPSQLELAIVGVVILTAVIADEAIKYFTGRRRAR